MPFILYKVELISIAIYTSWSLAGLFLLAIVFDLKGILIVTPIFVFLVILFTLANLIRLLPNSAFNRWLGYSPEYLDNED